MLDLQVVFLDEFIELQTQVNKFTSRSLLNPVLLCLFRFSVCKFIQDSTHKTPLTIRSLFNIYCFRKGIHNSRAKSEVTTTIMPDLENKEMSEVMNLVPSGVFLYLKI